MKRPLVILTALVFFPGMLLMGGIGVFAQEITLDQYLERVQENHPYFTKEDLNIDIEKKGAESLLGAEDWQLTIAPSYNFFGEASAPEYGGQERAHRLGVDAKIERSLWSTGGRLGFTATSSYLNTDPLMGPSERFKHGFGMSYTHPFLQNKRGVLDRLEYELSDFAVELQKVQSIENKEAFLLDAAVRYLDWVYYSEVVSIAKQRLVLAEEQLKQTDRKYKANLVDKVDLLRAEDAIRISKQTILQLEAQWMAKQAELAVISGTDDIYGLAPSYDLYALEPLPQKTEAVGRMREQSRLLRVFTVTRDQLLGRRRGFVEMRKPQLNVTVGGGFYGADEKFGDSLAIYNPDASVALVFSKTLDNRTMNATIEQLDLQVRQLDEEMRSVELDLESSMVSLLIRIVELEKVLALNRAQIESAEEKTEEELKLYNRGRSQLTFVIQSRDNEENARLSLAENAALYHGLILQYRALLDELLKTD